MTTLGYGTRLGPYEIVSAVGAGGMGEVYKARDTRLDRTVAIKVLPASLAGDRDRRLRFEREARAISSLNHPHICALYDVGEHDGFDFLVMEYVDGETLASVMQGGRLPPDRVLRYAVDIADALNAAHRQGIVHRDLKPGNVMVTRSGIKLLDFGLAKLGAGKAGEAGLTQGLTALATAPGSLTAEGTILGTIQYMSPEQVEGKEADARSDIFAFGTVVYEMATGRKAFEGQSPASVIAAILDRHPPPISTVQPVSPPALDHVVTTALQKDPDERWQSANDLKRELQWIAGLPEVSGTASAASGSQVASSRAAILKWTAAGAAIGATLAVFWAWSLAQRRAPALPVVSRTTITLPLDTALAGYAGPIWSQDGTRIAFLAERGGVSTIFLRNIGQFDATPLRGTEGAYLPFFSPDGDWVGFFSADGKLKKIAASGGTPLTICDASIGIGADWGADRTIVFAVYSEGRRSSLWRVSADSGTPQRLAEPDLAKGEAGYRYPQFLPGGEAVLFTVWLPERDALNRFAVGVMSLRTGERHQVADQGTYARVVPGGRVAYLTADGALQVAGFDPLRLTITTPAVTMMDGLPPNESGVGLFDVSRSGSLAYVAETARGGQGSYGAGNSRRTLVRVDRRGAASPLPAPARGYDDPRLSPDSRRLAVTVTQGSQRDIWIYDLNRESIARVTFGGKSAAPLWTPDGQRLVFWSDDGRRNLFWQAVDRSAAPERLLTNVNSQWAGSFTPDGRLLAYMQNDPTTDADIWVVPLDGERKPRPFIQQPAAQYGARLSPDGRFMAYASDESGRSEIFLSPFPDGGTKAQVSTGGGEEAVWARSGRELFYRSGNKMMAVSVKAEPALMVGKPEMLFERRYARCCPGLPEYDVTADGQGFYMIQDAEEATRSELSVVLNWSEELQRRVPTRR